MNNENSNNQFFGENDNVVQPIQDQPINNGVAQSQTTYPNSNNQFFSENNNVAQPMQGQSINDGKVQSQTTYPNSNFSSNFAGVNAYELNKKYGYDNFKPKDNNNKKNSGAIIAVLIILILIGVGVYFIFLRPKDDKKIDNNNNNIEEKNMTENENKNDNKNDEISSDVKHLKDVSVLIVTSTENPSKFLADFLTANGDKTNENKIVPIEQKARSVQLSAIETTFKSDQIRYGFHYPNDEMFYKYAISVGDFDSLLVLVSDGGIDQKLKEKLEFLHSTGVEYVAVYINTNKTNNESLKAKINEDLEKIGFDKYLVVSGEQSNLSDFNKDMKNMFSKIPEKSFLMAIEDVFYVTGDGNGTVATGRVESGLIKTNDEVEIIGLRNPIKTRVTKVESFREIKDSAEKGDNVGLTLEDIDRTDIERGQVVAKPGSIGTSRKFKAKVYILVKDEGGRSTPIVEGYRPQFDFRTAEIKGKFNIPSNKKEVNPGEIVNIEVELDESIAIQKGDQVRIKEDGRTIGVGIITNFDKD